MGKLLKGGHPHRMHLRPEILIIRCRLNFGKCQLFVTLGFVFRLSLGLGFKVTVYVCSRIIVGSILYDLYSPYFLLEERVKFMRRAMERFVTLIENSMHLIMCINFWTYLTI